MCNTPGRTFPNRDEPSCSEAKWGFRAVRLLALLKSNFRFATCATSQLAREPHPCAVDEPLIKRTWRVDRFIHVLSKGLWHAGLLRGCGWSIGGASSLGQGAIGADCNSLAHMISTDLLVRFIEFLRRSPELKEVFSGAAVAAKNRAKGAGCGGCFRSEGPRQGAGPIGSFSRQVSESDADSILMLYRCRALPRKK